MSELALQHERWTGARERMGMPHVQQGVVRFRSPNVPVRLIGPPSWRTIVRLVALKHGVTVEDMRSESQDHSLTRARYEACWLLKSHCDMTYAAIGRLFFRDRKTVQHGIKKYWREVA